MHDVNLFFRTHTDGGNSAYFQDHIRFFNFLLKRRLKDEKWKKKKKRQDFKRTIVSLCDDAIDCYFLHKHSVPPQLRFLICRE